MSQPKPIVRFDTAGIVRRVHKAAEAAMPEITNHIKKDCNMYAPYRSGSLQGENNYRDNVQVKINGASATISWEVPYANYVYKGVSKSGKDLKYNKHPRANAGSHWCERAKERHLAEWKKRVDKLVKEHFRNGS